MNTLLLVIIAILLPPLAVGLKAGIGFHLFLNIIYRKPAFRRRFDGGWETECPGVSLPSPRNQLLLSPLSGVR